MNNGFWCRSTFLVFRANEDISMEISNSSLMFFICHFGNQLVPHVYVCLCVCGHSLFGLSATLVRIKPSILNCGHRACLSALCCLETGRLASRSALEQLNQSEHLNGIEIREKAEPRVIFSLQHGTSIIQAQSYPRCLCISIVINLISQPMWTALNESVWGCFPIISSDAT